MLPGISGGDDDDGVIPGKRKRFGEAIYHRIVMKLVIVCVVRF